MKKRVDMGINNSTLINITGEGGEERERERECKSVQKFMRIKNVCLAKMRISYHSFMCESICRKVWDTNSKILLM